MREPPPTQAQKSAYLFRTLAGGMAVLAGVDPFGAVPDQAAVDEEMLLRQANRLPADDMILDQVRAKHTPAPGMTISGTTAEMQARMHELARMHAAISQPVTRTMDTTPRVSLPPGVAGL